MISYLLPSSLAPLHALIRPTLQGLQASGVGVIGEIAFKSLRATYGCTKTQIKFLVGSRPKLAAAILAIAVSLIYLALFRRSKVVKVPGEVREPQGELELRSPNCFKALEEFEAKAEGGVKKDWASEKLFALFDIALPQGLHVDQVRYRLELPLDKTGDVTFRLDARLKGQETLVWKVSLKELSRQMLSPNKLLETGTHSKIYKASSGLDAELNQVSQRDLSEGDRSLINSLPKVVKTLLKDTRFEKCRFNFLYETSSGASTQFVPMFRIMNLALERDGYLDRIKIQS